MRRLAQAAWPRRPGWDRRPAGPALPAPVPRPAAAAGDQPGPNGDALRLVASRPMWDAGVLVQRSPSLAGLHPPFALRLHPGDLARLGNGRAGDVRVSTHRGSVVVAVVADAGVVPGSAVLPFNLPEGGAGTLIDSTAAYQEVTVEAVNAP